MKLTTGFDRKNLFFAVKRPQNKQKELLAIVSEHKNQSGIIYCATRKNVEKVSDFLNENGYDSLIYHAGLSNGIRSKNQDDFINDRCNLIVATNAFGMGIDKPMCALSCIIICRKILKTTIRRQAEQVVTAKTPIAFCCTAQVMFIHKNFLLKIMKRMPNLPKNSVKNQEK